MIRPYRKYGDYYVPGCNIAFPTEQEAWEYIENIFYYRERVMI